MSEEDDRTFKDTTENVWKDTEDKIWADTTVSDADNAAEKRHEKPFRKYPTERLRWY